MTSRPAPSPFRPAKFPERSGHAWAPAQKMQTRAQMNQGTAQGRPHFAASVALSTAATSTVPPEVLAYADVLKVQRDHLAAELGGSRGDGVRLVAFPMIPESVWSQEAAHFLMMVCELFPASPENTLFLAGSPAAVNNLGLPVPPLGDRAEQADYVNKQVLNLRHEHAVRHLDVANRIVAGDCNALALMEPVRQACRDNVRAIARKLAVTNIGQERFDLHESLFSSRLGRGRWLA